MRYTTEETVQLVDTAAEAVRHLFSHTPADRNEQWLAADQAARRAVNAAMDADGVTAGQIAAQAGVRPLTVATMVRDHERRAQALVAARLDAERYVGQVMDAIRADVYDLWRTAGHDLPRGWKAETCQRYQISRPTLDEWIADWQNIEQE